MAEFEITGPDGKTYRVSGADAQGAYAALEAHLGAATQAKPQPNADGTYGQPPEGTVLDPRTGGMVTPEIMRNSHVNVGRGTAAAQGGFQGLSFGAGDEAIGAMYGLTGPGSFGENYDYATAKMRSELGANREEYPATTTAAEIGGAIAVPLGATATTGSLPVRMGKSAATGAALSGLYGFNAGEGDKGDRVDSAQNAAMWGAGIGAAVPVAGAMGERLVNALKGKKAIKAAGANAPTSEQLRQTGKDLYGQIDAAGVQIKPQAFSRARTDMTAAMADAGMDQLPGPGSLTPKSARVSQIAGEMDNTLTGTQGAALPFSSLDQLRRHAGTAAGDATNKTEQAAGSSAIGALDDFVKGLQPSDVTSGDVAALKSLIPKARDVWARMSRSQTIDDAIENSQSYGSGGASGLRNQFARILRNPKLMRGFSDAERKALQRVAKGSIPEQVLYNLAGGIGNIAAVAGGGAVGGLPGAALGVSASMGLKSLAERVAMRQAEVARGVVANGGLTALPKADPASRALIERLMRQGAAAGLD